MVTVGEGKGLRGAPHWTLVGGYSQYLYGAISQWEGAVLTPRGGKKGVVVVKTGSKRWRDEGVGVCVCARVA